MICTFGDITDVTWWRELDLPVRAVVGRNGRLLRRRRPRPSPTRPAEPLRASWPARPSTRPRQRIVELLGDAGELAASPRRSPTRSSSTRRATARSRSSPAASGTSATAAGTTRPPGGARSAAAGSSTGTRRYMQVRYENWVEGLNGDWLISRQRFFGVPDPGLVRGRRRRRARPRPRSWSPTRTPLPSTRPPTPRPATTRTSGASPAASSATPTSWTPGRPRRSRPRSPAAGTTTPTSSARVFPMDLRPQGHEIIRTWLFSTVVRAPLRARHRAVEPRRHLRLDPRSRPQEDVEVEGQRRHADGRCSSSTAPTPSATGPPTAARAPTPPSTRAR